MNVLRAAYPGRRIEYRRVWGAYMAAYGFNNVVPARGGDIIKLFLTKTSIPHSSYPAVGSSFFVEAIFDVCMAVMTAGSSGTGRRQRCRGRSCSA